MNPGVQRLLSQGLDRPQAWFVQNNSGLVQRLTRTDGHALRFRMRTEGFERRVDVGTTSPDSQTWWRPIEECSLEMEHRSSPPPMALPKPGVAPTPIPNPRARGRSREPEQILPHPRIERLRTALKQGDWKEARQSSDRLQWLLKGAKDIGITHYRGEAEELLEISRKALRHLMPRATLVTHSQKRIAAPSTTPVPAPRQSQPTPKTAGIPAQPRRSKNKKQNRRRGSTSAVTAQRSELATKVDENALLKLQERFNSRRQ